MIELLFIHGILGKPEYFNFLQPYVPEGFHTTAILLDGHGKGPREFAGSSMEQWRRQVAETVDNLLSKGNKVIIVAHSMGCLFAIDAAVRGKADALFLLNPPLSLRISRKLFSTPLKMKMGKINDNWVQAAKDAYSISDDGNLVNYLCWIPRYFELFREIYRIRRIVSCLAVPTRVYLSTHTRWCLLVRTGSFRCVPKSMSQCCRHQVIIIMRITTVLSLLAIFMNF